jgi:hypothetical protein
LVHRHDIYSCPDTADYKYISGAQSLLLHSRSPKRSAQKLVDAEIPLAKDNPDFTIVPRGFRARLQAYITEAATMPGILDAVRHNFYFLRPDWIQNYACKKSLATVAALALWQEKTFWFRWPKQSVLLQPEWVRDSDGNRADCYRYDAELKRRLRRKNLKPDGRNNGPAILSFLMAGGQRPVCGDEGWPIHHVYDGQALVPGTQRRILHAVQNGQHFTHSGGLVALHPAAHLVVHQSEFLAWLLRREAFIRFGYDPDNIFSRI